MRKAADGISSFGRLLRGYRVERDLSQGELAERAGLSLQAVSALERGLRRGPRVETVRLLGAALGLSEAQVAILDAAASRRRGAGSPPGIPPVSPTSPAVAGLPVALTPLVGRERDEAAVVHLLRRDAPAHLAVRLLTLIGPGGVGKTRLAMQVAAGMASSFADGLLWVDLAPLREAGLLMATIARRLGLQEGGAEPLQEQVRRTVRDKDLLLVLDNFEHLLPGRTALVDLLVSCPHLTMLVTSRAALHVRGEQEYRVGALALPEPGATPEAIGQSAAVLLFMQRARAIRPELALTEQNAPVVGELCRRLDGLPLAIELAAGLVNLMPLQALLARLGRPEAAHTPRVPGAGRREALDVLMGGAWDLPDRQQSLRATLDWSHDLLAPEEQVLFRRLAAFSGGAALDAVETVCQTLGEPPGRTLAAVRSLLDKSLVQAREPTGAQGPRPFTSPDPVSAAHAQHAARSARVGMLETVRDYAIERLAADGEEEAVREAHALHFLALAEQAEAALNGPDQALWYEVLEREHDNLRAALAWTQEGSALDSATRRSRRALGLQLAGALWEFWHAHGHLSEGRTWLARCLEATTVTDETPARAKALNGAGWMAAMQGDYSQAIALLTTSLSLYRALNDAAGQSFALANLAGVSYRHADYGRAAELYEQALAMARVCGDRPNMINALNSLALIAREQGDYARATELYSQCLAVSRELGHFEYVALSSLGRLAREQGNLGRARALLEEALGLAQQAGDTTHAAGVLFNLAVVVRQQGDDERAAALLQESTGLHRAMGHQDGLGVTLLHLGLISAARGTPEKAVQQCTEALSLCATAGETPRVAECFEGLAEVWRAYGSGEQASRLCGVAEALRARIGASLPDADRAVHESTVRRLRASLGDGTFSAAWQAGQALSLQQALAEACAAAATLDGYNTGR